MASECLFKISKKHSMYLCNFDILYYITFLITGLQANFKSFSSHYETIVKESILYEI
jgi:hypothetical protein